MPCGHRQVFAHLNYNWLTIIILYTERTLREFDRFSVPMWENFFKKISRGTRECMGRLVGNSRVDHKCSAPLKIYATTDHSPDLKLAPVSGADFL